MISIIVAIATNGVIGCHNRLIWHISEDLKRFKSLTMGHPIVMGRKTFASIGRALPGRQNIVISRDKALKIDGVDVVASMEEAIKIASTDGEIFILGGGEIYHLALPLASKLYVTQVEQSPQGDTFFPEIDENEWLETHREEHEGFAFIDYSRR
ncbi:MAG: dihydrofolate reductase [Mucinivorans sp.]